MSYKFALAKFIKSPQAFGRDQVFAYNDDYVVVPDGFPKSTFHYLLCPRDPKISNQSPLSFEILPSGIELIDQAKEHIIEEFKKKYGYTIDESFIQVGCHAAPSLANLHIHILTKDFHNVRLKNKQHYNSFNTEFFVPLNELPLSRKDHRRNQSTMEELKKGDLECVYCHRSFSNKFKQFKEHLEQEFASLIS
jgi:aprataxin